VLINPARNPSIFRRRFPIRLWYPSQHLLRQNPLPRSQFGSRRRFPSAPSQPADSCTSGMPWTAKARSLDILVQPRRDRKARCGVFRRYNIDRRSARFRRWRAHPLMPFRLGPCGGWRSSRISGDAASPRQRGRMKRARVFLVSSTGRDQILRGRDADTGSGLRTDGFAAGTPSVDCLFRFAPHGPPDDLVELAGCFVPYLHNGWSRFPCDGFPGA
jgi:hypothetical protein